MLKKLIHNLLLILAITVVPLTAHSETSTSDSIAKIMASPAFLKLSPQQQEMVLKELNDPATAEKEAVDTLTSADSVLKWAQIGSEVGKAIGGAARELNIATNDFIKTPVGQLTMWLIVWHFLGGPLIHVFGALVIMFVSLWFIRRFLIASRDENIQYDLEHKNWFGNHPILSHTKTAITKDDRETALLIGFVMSLVMLGTLFTY